VSARRGLLLVAAALLLLSLGLPWATTAGTPGTLLPGGSIISVNPDGSMRLELLPSTYVPGLSGVTVNGHEHTMRVTGAAGALLVATGVRRRRRPPAVAGLLVASLAVPIGLVGGVGIGRVTYALAIGAAALSLRPAAPRTPATT